MKSKSLITVIIIAVIAALGAAWYFLWYVPHTPIYTFQIIRQGVEEKNADKVLAHIDTKSLVKNIVTREGDTYVDTSKPWGRAAIAATKAFGPGLLDDIIRQYIENPDLFKSQDSDSESTNDETNTEENRNTISMIDRIARGELFNQHDIEVKNITSIEEGDTATVTATIQNNKTHMTKDIRVLLRHLGDGTWIIYDIPDIEDLYQVTRK